MDNKEKTIEEKLEDLLINLEKRFTYIESRVSRIEDHLYRSDNLYLTGSSFNDE